MHRPFRQTLTDPSTKTGVIMTLALADAPKRHVKIKEKIIYNHLIMKIL